MIPARLSVLWKMATPRRYMSKSYPRSISGDIYGGGQPTSAFISA